jgi:hypothetical protein
MIEVEAGHEGAVCPPILELHARVDVGVADETRSKRSALRTMSERKGRLIIRIGSVVMYDEPLFQRWTARLTPQTDGWFE